MHETGWPVQRELELNVSQGYTNTLVEDFPKESTEEYEIASRHFCAPRQTRIIFCMPMHHPSH